MHKFLVDTFALVVFSTVAGALTEYFIANLTIAQVVQTRIVALPVIIATARPYGIYRDWLQEKFKSTSDPGAIRATLQDMFAFVSFQVPVYAANLLIAGASLTQILAATGSALVILLVTGRPYGLFLEFCRRLFKVTDKDR